MTNFPPSLGSLYREETKYGVCGEFGCVRFLVVCSYIKPILTHEKIFGVGKSAPSATFNLFFLGLGWPCVGELVDFIIIFTWYMFSDPT